MIRFAERSTQFTSMITQDEIRHESEKYSRIFLATLENAGESVGAFMVFTYGSSLRFKVLLSANVGDDDFAILRHKIDEYRSAVPSDKQLLWYTVIDEEIDRERLSVLENDEGAYYFRELSIDRRRMAETCRDHSESRVTVSEYRPDLLDACVAILESAFTPTANPPGSFVRERETIDRELQSKRNAKCLVLFIDGKPIGLANYAKGVLDYVAVAEGSRGRGYGTYLMKRIFADVLANTDRGLRLFCREDNVDAQRFHAKLGFSIANWSARVTLR